MTALPDPPAGLPSAPRAFYDDLRAAVAELGPTEIDESRMEVSFGDGGVAVTLPHRREEDWTIAAQVSRAAAVVFAGPATAHFDASGGDRWPRDAAALVATALSGEVEVEVAYRGDQVVRVDRDRVWSLPGLAVWRPLRVERVRVDFGGRRG